MGVSSNMRLRAAMLASILTPYAVLAFDRTNIALSLSMYVVFLVLLFYVFAAKHRGRTLAVCAGMVHALTPLVNIWLFSHSVWHGIIASIISISMTYCIALSALRREQM